MNIHVINNTQITNQRNATKSIKFHGKLFIELINSLFTNMIVNYLDIHTIIMFGTTNKHIRAIICSSILPKINNIMTNRTIISTSTLFLSCSLNMNISICFSAPVDHPMSPYNIHMLLLKVNPIKLCLTIISLDDLLEFDGLYSHDKLVEYVNQKRIESKKRNKRILLKFGITMNDSSELNRSTMTIIEQNEYLKKTCSGDEHVEKNNSKNVQHLETIVENKLSDDEYLEKMNKQCLDKMLWIVVPESVLCFEIHNKIGITDQNTDLPIDDTPIFCIESILKRIAKRTHNDTSFGGLQKPIPRNNLYETIKIEKLPIKFINMLFVDRTISEISHHCALYNSDQHNENKCGCFADVNNSLCTCIQFENCNIVTNKYGKCNMVPTINSMWLKLWFVMAYAYSFTHGHSGLSVHCLTTKCHNIVIINNSTNAINIQSDEISTNVSNINNISDWIYDINSNYGDMCSINECDKNVLLLSSCDSSSGNLLELILMCATLCRPTYMYLYNCKFVPIALDEEQCCSICTKMFNDVDMYNNLIKSKDKTDIYVTEKKEFISPINDISTKLFRNNHHHDHRHYHHCDHHNDASHESLREILCIVDNPQKKMCDQVKEMLESLIEIKTIPRLINNVFPPT